MFLAVLAMHLLPARKPDERGSWNSLRLVSLAVSTAALQAGAVVEA